MGLAAPLEHDFVVVRGTAGADVAWDIQFKYRDEDGEWQPREFDDVWLTITTIDMQTVLLRKTMSAGDILLTDPEEGEIMWPPTAEDTMAIPLGGRSAYYEFELRLGSEPVGEAVPLHGYVTGVGGANDLSS